MEVDIAGNPGVQGLVQISRNAIDRVTELEAENVRLRRKVNALLDAISEHTSKAASRRIVREIREVGGDG